MAFDLDAIKRKIETMNGQNRQRSNFWKPEVGEHTVRILPMDAGPEDLCFVRKFYYCIPGQTLVAPSQFGHKDPIADYIKELSSDKASRETNKEFLKTLYPKPRVFAPIIVRGEEEKGVQIWSFSPNLYSTMLGWVVKYGEDFRDIESGYDIDVSITKIAGKKFNDTKVELGRRPSALAKDKATADKWLKALPDLTLIYPEKPADEIKKLFSAWLAGDTASTREEVRGEQSKGADVEELAKSIASAKANSAAKAAPAARTPAAAVKAAVKPAPAAPVIADDDEPLGDEDTNLDDAFAEVLDS